MFFCDFCEISKNTFYTSGGCFYLILQLFKPFLANILILYSLKTAENTRKLEAGI